MKPNKSLYITVGDECASPRKYNARIISVVVIAIAAIAGVLVFAFTREAEAETITITITQSPQSTPTPSVAPTDSPTKKPTSSPTYDPVDWRSCNYDTITKEVHIFIGQSNMVGYNSNAGHPRCKDTSTNAQFVNYCTVTKSKAMIQEAIDNIPRGGCDGICQIYKSYDNLIEVLADDDTGVISNSLFLQFDEGDLKPLRPGLQFGRYIESNVDNKYRGCSPMISTAYLLNERAPNVQRYYINLAVTGTKIEQWLQNQNSGYYNDFITETQRLLSYFHTGTYKIAGIYWNQGEKDANSGTPLLNYMFNMVQIISSLKTDLDDPNIPIFDTLLPETTTNAALLEKTKVINEAKLNMRNNNSTQALIGDRSNMGGFQDSVHYCPVGYTNLGALYAEAYLSHAYGYRCEFEGGIDPQQDDSFEL